MADTLYPKGELMLRNATEQSGAARLAAVGSNFSSASKGLPIQPSKNYRISFTARRPGGGGSTKDGLNVQLYNFDKGYGGPELERKVSNLADDWRPYSVTINTGKNAPSDAMVRLYTYDTSVIEVKDVRICHLAATVTSTCACSGTNAGGGNGHLYRELTTLPSGATLFRNEQALPAARFVRHVRSAKDLPEIQQILVEAQFNPEDEALVSGSASARSYAAGSVQSFDDGKADHVRLSATTEGQAFLVLSLLYYPGWHARVDGRPVALVKTYGVLTGLEVSHAGKHEITLDFIPDSFWLGVQWAVIGFAAFTVLVAGAQWLNWRRDRTEPTSQGAVQ